MKFDDDDNNGITGNTGKIAGGGFGGSNDLSSI